MSTDIDTDGSCFLRDHIESYEQLEIILILRLRGVPMSPADIASSTRVAPTLTAAALTALVERGLVASSASDGTFAYRSHSIALDAVVDTLQDTLRTEPSKVLRILNAQAIERIRAGAAHAFADAFLLRKDKNDG